MPEDKSKIAELEAINDKLAHEVIEGKILSIHGEIMSMNDMLHQRITDGEEKTNIEFCNIKKGLDEIKEITQATLSQATRTNGRVNKIENEREIEKKLKEIKDKDYEEIKKNTRAVRFLHKYPIVTTWFLLVGFLFSLPEIRQPVAVGVKQFFLIFGKIF